MKSVANTLRHPVRRDALGWISSVAFLFLVATDMPAAANWQTTLTNDPPGNFASLRPLHASYVFGWSGFTAATAEIQFSRVAPDRCQLQGTGHTIGLART